MTYLLGIPNLAPDVRDQPYMAVTTWRRFHWQEWNTMYLMLRHQPPSAAVSKIRMTSAIVGITPAMRTVRTNSGRIYELNLPPTEDHMLQAAFNEYAGLQTMGEYSDVSFEIWSQLTGAVH